MAANDAGYAMESDQEMSGILYGVGLGPGDPELITLKAARLIAAAKVVAYPALAGGNSFARSIASDLIAPGAREIVMEVPMTVARQPAQDAYDSGAAAIAAALEAGEDVVCLCEGDPFFYGSFMYLYARLFERFTVEVVPGVSSVMASAARARQPLVARNEVMTVIPGPLEAADMRARIETADSSSPLHNTKMLLQIHDELVFETPDALAQDAKGLIVERMEAAMDLKVPLIVDAHVSSDWFGGK